MTRKVIGITRRESSGGWVVSRDLVDDKYDTVESQPVAEFPAHQYDEADSLAFDLARKDGIMVLETE